MPDGPDMNRLCLHTITTRSWGLRDAARAYREAGAGGITVWRDAVGALGLNESAKVLADSGLEVVSLCRGGFFTGTSDKARAAAIDDNRRVIDEAAAIGAPLVVLVCGATPGVALDVARGQIADAIAAIEPHARQAGVKLGIEPLHPMYADTRSAVSTLGQANDLVKRIGSKQVGVTIDVYHVWWDDRLAAEIDRAGRNESIFSFHVCDWLSPTSDLLNDRGIMGEGCIDIRGIRAIVESAGFNGMIEVEIFSNRCWALPPEKMLRRVCAAYREHV